MSLRCLARRFFTLAPSVLAAASIGAAHEPAGIQVGADGAIFYVDFTAHRVMRLEPGEEPMPLTVAPSGSPAFSVPHHLHFGPDGALYTAADRGGSVWRIAPRAGGLTLYYPPANQLGLPFLGAGGDPFAIDGEGRLYGVQSVQRKTSQILRVSLDGRIEEFAGGAWGHADGRGPEARFGNLHGGDFAWRPDGTLLLSDSGTWLRAIDAEGVVRTVAGGAERGHVDGPAEEARFGYAMGLAVDTDGTIYVADAGNRAIRRVAPDGQVATLYPPASPSGDAETTDAKGPTLHSPSGVAVHPDGGLVVLDHERDMPRVYRLSADGGLTLLYARPSR